MKNTDFRNFLNVVDALETKKTISRKTLKESPADTYYVSKMKERFIAMEDEASTSAPTQEFNTPSSAEDTLTHSEPSEGTLSDENLETAISTIKSAIAASPEASSAFEEVLKHFGCEAAGCETGKEVSEPEEKEELKAESATSKWNFGSFMK